MKNTNSTIYHQFLAVLALLLLAAPGVRAQGSANQPPAAAAMPTAAPTSSPGRIIFHG